MANKKDTKKEPKLEKTEFGDIVKNNTLIKRTLMVSAFPALVKETEKDGKPYYEGFLPGFEFSEVEGSHDIGECMYQLQELLDENVEELVVFGQQLPNLPEDEELEEKNPGYVVRYLDINVYAEPEDMPYICGCEGDCDDDCDCCGHDCDCNDDCDCHEHHCDCDDEECDCDEDCDCGCKEGKECTCEHDHKDHKCKCNHEHDENHKCNCKNKKK